MSIDIKEFKTRINSLKNNCYITKGEKYYKELYSFLEQQQEEIDKLEAHIEECINERNLAVIKRAKIIKQQQEEIDKLEAENKELREGHQWVEDMEPGIGLHVLTTEEYVNNKGKTITRVFENIYWGAGNWDEGEDDLIKKWRYMPKPPKEDV